jgi:hypothetical protein
MKKKNLVLLVSFLLIILNFPSKANKNKNTDSIRLITKVTRECGTDIKGNKVPFHINGPYISGQYALVGCIFGEGGGEGLYTKTKKGDWNLLIAGGGALGEQGLLEYGVPIKDVKNIMRQQEEYLKRRKNKQLK